MLREVAVLSLFKAISTPPLLRSHLSQTDHILLEMGQGYLSGEFVEHLELGQSCRLSVLFQHSRRDVFAGFGIESSGLPCDMELSVSANYSESVAISLHHAWELSENWV